MAGGSGRANSRLDRPAFFRPCPTTHLQRLRMLLSAKACSAGAAHLAGVGAACRAVEQRIGILVPLRLLISTPLKLLIRIRILILIFLLLVFFALVSFSSLAIILLVLLPAATLCLLACLLALRPRLLC